MSYVFTDRGSTIVLSFIKVSLGADSLLLQISCLRDELTLVNSGTRRVRDRDNLRSDIVIVIRIAILLVDFARFLILKKYGAFINCALYVIFFLFCC